MAVLRHYYFKLYSSSMLTNKKILLCVTGSIAAYKAVYILRYLMKEGATVKVIMTEKAAEFVSPLTFSTLSGERVLQKIFTEDEWENHALLGRWADLMLIAPATANTIASMANGICSNLLTAVYLSATCPVMIAPAMDEDMWKHPSTMRNIQKLIYDRVKVLQVNEGDLASGLKGMGRMKEPDEIVASVKSYFTESLLFAGKKVLVTAGPTIERIDPVRFISNDSSGKMGVSIAQAFFEAGADVRLVCGPVQIELPGSLTIVKVKSAFEMYNACMEDFDSYDVIIMAAAVADFTPASPEHQKVKKKEEEISITLLPTRDILATAGQRKKENQILVGFALETNNEEENALKKLSAKNADFIILNSLNDDGAGFSTDTNKVTIFGRGGGRWEFPLKFKKEIARDIVKFLSQHS